MKEIKNYISDLPEYIKINNITYKLYYRTLLGCVKHQISYVPYYKGKYEWGEEHFLSKWYNLVENLGLEISIMDKYDSYKLTMEDIVEDYKQQLSNYEYELWDGVDSDQNFYNDLTNLLNRYSKENDSNTPDYILANYLYNSLQNFNNVISQREIFYNREINNVIKEENYECR